MPAFRFQLQETDTSVYLNIKHNAVSLMLDADAVYTFDREGRLTVAWIDGRTYRRGLDNRLLCRYRVSRATGVAVRRQWLDASAGRSLIDRVALDVRRILTAVSRNRVAPAGDFDAGEVQPWLRKLAGWNFEALGEQARRFKEVYRPITILPPDQYMALVLQATEGCHYNRCTFCAFYKDRTFRIKTEAEFRRHIAEVLGFLGEGRLMRKTLFLGDANALCIERDRLLPLLDAVNEALPIRSAGFGNTSAGSLDGICSFMDVFSEPSRDESDFRELQDRNVVRIYLGVETGSRRLLRFLRKPQTPDQVRETVVRIKKAGIGVGVIIMLGIGGDRYAGEHVLESLDLLNSLPWSQGDLVFLSELIEFPNLEYSELIRREGISALTHPEMEAQFAAIRDGVRQQDGGPRIAPYCAEDFLY